MWTAMEPKVKQEAVEIQPEAPLGNTAAVQGVLLTLAAREQPSTLPEPVAVDTYPSPAPCRAAPKTAEEESGTPVLTTLTVLLGI